MQFKQFYLGCLSQASYYIGSGSEAAVIDPQRDVEQYIEEAKANSQQIKYVIETHSHADFVSGHVELAKRSGAQIVFGSRAETQFDALKVADGDTLPVGSIELKFLETPGHTPESISVLANGSDNGPAKLFTGDTLFIGDVGRPDLIGSKGFSAEDMAGMLYDSLRNKILPLPDETEIYPAHGAGSLCGKSLSKETWSTLGEQRRSNYALQPMEREEFVALVTTDQPRVPAYFENSARQNLSGPVSVADLPSAVEMDLAEVREFDGIVVDVRTPAEFGAGHVPNAINIGLDGKFATWAGTFIPVGIDIAVAAGNREQVDEAILRLARVGIESARAFILMEKAQENLNQTPQVEPGFVERLLIRSEPVQFIDVRQPGEHSAGHAVGTINLPVASLTESLDRLDPKLPTYVICQSGYRSSIATSLLENAGFEHVSNVKGGTLAWIDAGLPTERSKSTAA